MTKKLQDAFDMITSFSIDKDGRLHISDIDAYLKACSEVEEALNKISE